MKQNQSIHVLEPNLRLKYIHASVSKFLWYEVQLLTGGKETTISWVHRQSGKSKQYQAAKGETGKQNGASTGATCRLFPSPFLPQCVFYSSTLTSLEGVFVSKCKYEYPCKWIRLRSLRKPVEAANYPSMWKRKRVSLKVYTEETDLFIFVKGYSFSLIRSSIFCFDAGQHPSLWKKCLG